MKTPNPDHPIRNTLKHLALGVAAAAAFFASGPSANAAPPVTTGLKLHLDASALTGLSDGNTVNTWTDVSGLNNHATRTSGAPTYETNELGGKPVVRFPNGGGAYFSFPNMTDIRTVFWVVKESTANMHFLLGHSSNYDFHRGDGAQIWHGNWTSNNIKNGTTRLNGPVVNGTTTTLPAGWNLVSLGTTGNVSASSLIQDRVYGRNWEGDIAEVLIYNVALSPADELLVGGYLTAKYALTTSYPIPAATPPTGLVATPLRNAIRLDWTASASFGVTGYKVDRLTGTGGTIDATYDASGLTYTDTTVTTGGPYYYVVRAVNYAGAGAASAEASASPSAVPVDQTITFALGLAVTKTAADAPFADTASAFPSGLPVTYSSDTPAVATVDASTGVVTLTGVPGTAHILADQAGNADVNAATQVSQTLTVTQATPVITWDTPTPIQVGTLLSSTQLNASSGGVDGAFVYDPPSGTALALGTHTLSVQFTPADTVKYSTPAPKTVEQLVVPVESTVIWNTGNGTWNTTAANWKGGGSGLPTIYTQGNNVIFDKTTGGTITIAADMSPLTTTVSATSGTYTFSGGPIATGTLTKSGGGSLVLMSPNTYTGGTVLNGGYIIQANLVDGVFGTGPITLNNGAYVQFSRQASTNQWIINSGTFGGSNSFGDGNSGPITLNGTLTVETGGTGNRTLSGIISGAGSILKTGSGNGQLVLYGANTYSGGTTHQGGILGLGHANALGTGTLVMDGTTQTLTAEANLNVGTGVTNNIVLSKDCTVRLWGNWPPVSYDMLLSGTISGPGGMTLTGGYLNANKTLVLTGTNTYTGATTVNAGTLLVNNTTGSGTGTGNVSVTAGTLGGSGAISGAVTIGNGTGTADSILAPGNSIGTIATGNLAFSSDGSYAAELNGTSVTTDVTNVTGTVTINAATTLTVSLTGSLAAGQKYFIVNNDGVDAVTGTFAGKAQDAVVGNFGGTDLKISYTGNSGTSAITGGNDIVLYTDASGSPYDTWADGTFTNPFTDKDPAHNPDGDTLTNLQEYAFGTDPTVSTGEIVYSGGTLTTPGAPKIVAAAGTYSMVFGRRADYVAAGLTYTVQFSAGLDTWVDNDDGTNPPVQVATDGTINAMSVPFVDFIDTPSGSRKPTFARVKVTMP